MALERTAIPREFSGPRRFNRRFRLILATVGLAALAGPVGCMAAIANRPEPETPTLEPRHADFAAVVAHSYLDGETLPVPVADGISAAAGRESLPTTTSSPTSSPTPSRSPTRWVISMGAEVAVHPGGRGVAAHRRDPPLPGGGASGPFVLAVPVIQTPGGAPALGAVPAIEPFVPDAAADDLGSLDWSRGLRDRPGVRHAPAAHRPSGPPAFAADDRRQLLEITGDSRNGIEYVGPGRRGGGGRARGRRPVHPQRRRRRHPRRGRAGGRRRPRRHHPGVVRPAGRGTPTSPCPRSWPGVRRAAP